MSFQRAVIAAYKLSAFGLAENTKDITDEESLGHALENAACANWLLGHILLNRDNVLRMIGSEGVMLEPQLPNMYARGTNGSVTAEQAGLSFTELKSRLTQSQEIIASKLAAMTDGDLCQPLENNPTPFPVSSLGEMLTIFAGHEMYHAGQLGILRLAMGKTGAIR